MRKRSHETAMAPFLYRNHPIFSRAHAWLQYFLLMTFVNPQTKLDLFHCIWNRLVALFYLQANRSNMVAAECATLIFPAGREMRLTSAHSRCRHDLTNRQRGHLQRQHTHTYMFGRLSNVSRCSNVALHCIAVRISNHSVAVKCGPAS